MKKLTLSLVLVLFISVVSFSQPFGDGRGKGQNRFELKEELKLTDAQEQQISDIRYQHQQFLVDTKAQIQKKRLELKKMMMDNNVNEASYLKLADEIAELDAGIHKANMKHFFEIYKLLDADQQEIFAKHFAERGADMGKGNRNGGFGRNQRFEKPRMR